jgi:hypothetical protein
MGFTIPNYEYAVAHGVGDQAEPDSVDFQVLGNNTCALIYDETLATNGAVTVSGTSYVISVAAYKAISNGNHLSKDSATSITLTSGGANPRYDLVVIPSNNVPTVRIGTTSSTNPVFPSLTDGDVLLAAIYRPAGGTGASEATSGRITDKRKFVLANTTWLKDTAPTSTDGLDGDLWIDTTATATGQSMLWVKRSGAWENLAEYYPLATANTGNTIVQRDSSGNFSAGTITASLNGNATTASSASAVAWGNVSGKPSLVENDGNQYNISISGNANYANSAGSATSASNANTVGNYSPSETWNASNTVVVRNATQTVSSYRFAGDRIRNNAWDGYTSFESQTGTTLMRVSNDNTVYSLAVSGRAVQINTNGTLGTTSSTRRVKENISEYESSALLEVSPVTFDYKEGHLENGEDRYNHFGLIAEDLVEVGLDHLVYKDSNGRPEGVAYEKVAVELLSVVKQLAARIDALEAK